MKLTNALLLAALSPLATPALADTRLDEIRVEAGSERADGPVGGYRATRSATFTKTDTALKEVPASVSVVSAELMQDQAMQSLADVIRNVPGAMAHQGEGNRDQFILRGISTSSDIYVDGMRDDAQVFRDLYNLERVEVLKGTGGMIFGRGSAGGIVNLVTKKPVFDDVGAAQFMLGSYQQVQTSVDLGRRADADAAWRLNATASTGNSFRHGVDSRRIAANPTLTQVIDAQTSVTFGIEHLDDQRTSDRGVPALNGQPIKASPGTFYGNADQSSARSRVDSFYAYLDRDFGDLQLKNKFRMTHYDKYYQNVYADNANTSSVIGGNLKLAAYNNANQRDNFFNQTDLTRRVTLGGMEHTLLAGMELGRQNSKNQRNTGFFGGATTLTVAASSPYGTATRFAPNGTDANNRVTANIFALYAQDQISLTPEWKLLAGLRYDDFTVHFDDRRTTTTQTDLDRTDTAWSPRLGLIWSPNAAQTYYASYSFAFLPTLETLSLTAGAGGLEPEQAKNYEFGGRIDLHRDLTLTTAVFRLDRDNVRNSDGAGGFVQTGQQRTEGVEIALEGRVTRDWQVHAGYAHLNSRITKATASAASTLNHRPMLTPGNAFTLWNRVTLDAQWSVGAGLVYQGSSFANVDNAVQLPAYTRADAALYYQVDRRSQLAVNVENLFDRNYFATADGNNNISPGAPRNLRLTLTTKF